MFCECGCGGKAPIARQTCSRYGWTKGMPVRFIPGHNQRTVVRTKGYPVVRIHGHPRANASGYVLEHIVIAERALGRPLPAGAEVHHVDENSLNNAPTNLVICQSREYHDLLHVRARVLRAGGDPNTQRICHRCRRALPMEQFYPRASNKNGGVSAICRACNRAVCRARRAFAIMERQGYVN